MFNGILKENFGQRKVVCYTSLRVLGFDDFSDDRMELDRRDWGFL